MKYKLYKKNFHQILYKCIYFLDFKDPIYKDKKIIFLTEHRYIL